MLQDIGAYPEGDSKTPSGFTDLWIYRNESQNKVCIIHIFEGLVGYEGMKQALKTEGSTVLFYGHSNYGTGGVFATQEEYHNRVIEDLYFMDDARIINYSSKSIAVSISGMRRGQAYPFWQPVFKDRTSAIMPYDFGDPRGDPPYNYYLTYQVPGDPTYYKVETVHNSAKERFADSERPAWYSPDGALPDSTNPDHLQYFITNSEEWYPSIEVIGDWQESREVLGFYRETYHLTSAGLGADRFRWIFSIPQPGNYTVSAWWPASESMTSNANYTINHAGGSTSVFVNQTVNGGQWNELDEFYFDVGEYSVVLSDDADAGNVVADAVRIAYADPEVYDNKIDNVDYPKKHYGSKTILFRREMEIPEEELKYDRLLYLGCDSGTYYIDTFHRGIFFYTLAAGWGSDMWVYLKADLEGKSNYEIWEKLMENNPYGLDYYNFNKLPLERQTSGTISGTVTNTSFNPIQGATVTASNGDSTTTDATGSYTLTNIPIGNYTVTASAIGYDPQSQENIEVREDQTTTLDFQLGADVSVVGLWHFDEGSGIVAVDLSGNENHGTINGATWTTGKIGSALNFDGVDDYVDCGQGASLNIRNEITIEAWVNTNDISSQQKIVDKRGAWNSLNGYSMFIAGQNLYFEYGNGTDYSQLSRGMSYAAGEWVHVAITLEGSTVTYYKNGSALGTRNGISGIATNAYHLAIGRSLQRSGLRFNGTIDEVQIYNRTLNADEINIHYQEGISEQSMSFLEAKGVLASATEPTRPAVGYPIFDAKKEAKINEIANLPLEEAFAKFKDEELVVNDTLLHKAIFTAFQDRRQVAIDLALEHLKLPIMETVDNKPVNRFDDFYIAKKILHVFPEESEDSLLELYESSDAITKRNIIYVLGQMEGSQAIRDLLIGALNDKTFCEVEDLEMDGPPLRICDAAYNQLVLRYKIKNVLRTIGTVYTIENRDYHIEILKSQL